MPTPANVDQIETMGERFGELDIALWSVFFLIPVGRATEMERLNADECEAAFARLHVQARLQPFMNPHRVILLSFPTSSRPSSAAVSMESPKHTVSDCGWKPQPRCSTPQRDR
ncbi:hypothetical protein [Novipirellula aureliae]|nr:hypothetical protein [Novipirellula aureliae]